MSIITSLIDASKLGGWTRAGVASVLPVIIAAVPGLNIDASTQAAIGVVVSALVVGAWSHFVKA